MSFWKRLFTRKPKNTRIIIEIHEDRFDLEVEWQKATEMPMEAAETMANALTAVCYVMTSTPIGIQRAIMAVAAKAEHQGDHEFGQYVTNKLMSMSKEKKVRTGPLVGPTEAFGLQETTRRGRNGY